jgi:hypothetical protein
MEQTQNSMMAIASAKQATGRMRIKHVRNAQMQFLVALIASMGMCVKDVIPATIGYLTEQLNVSAKPITSNKVMNANNVLWDATSAQIVQHVIHVTYRGTGFLININSVDAKMAISMRAIIRVRAAYWDALFVINLKNV